ncbi:uncharacterized protein BYT42DRAFT_344653 [Radiomyces spectabilis]|uniref:uncharacterized protein n=1 Tax=Radiomyces spectabilis TaxID=64574 RepID=UPI00221E7754|nr:uncharacterized protein BYT42DRAFT_344653 [Radiomyces spectabilis]KAI8377443.1 hypothetical protein BYT42DRAFT_344653 [Radiomyces spectabilis]
MNNVAPPRPDKSKLRSLPSSASLSTFVEPSRPGRASAPLVRSFSTDYVATSLAVQSPTVPPQLNASASTQPSLPARFDHVPPPTKYRSRFIERFDHTPPRELLNTLSESTPQGPERRPRRQSTVKRLRLALTHSHSTSVLETISSRVHPSTPTAAAGIPAVSSPTTPTPASMAVHRTVSDGSIMRSPVDNGPQESLTTNDNSRESSITRSAGSSLQSSASTPTSSFMKPQRLGSSQSMPYSTTKSATSPTKISNKMSLANLNRAKVIINRLEEWLHFIRTLISWTEEVSKICLQSSRSYYHRALPLSEDFDSTNGPEIAMATIQAGLSMLTMQVAEEQRNFSRKLRDSYLPCLVKFKKECKEKIRSLKSNDDLLSDELLRRAETTRKSMSQLNKACKAAEKAKHQIEHDPWLANLYVLRYLKQEINEENRLRLLMVDVQKDTADFEQRLIEAVKPIVQFCYEYLAPGAWHHASDPETASMKLVMDQIIPNHEWHAFAEKNVKELVPEHHPTKDYLKINYPHKLHPYVLTLQKGKMQRRTGVLKQYIDRYYVLSQCGYLHQFRLDDKVSPEHSIYIPQSTIVPSVDISHLANQIMETTSDNTKQEFTFEIIRPGNARLQRDKAYEFRVSSRKELLDWCRLLCEIATRPPGAISQTLLPQSSLLLTSTLSSGSSSEALRSDNSLAVSVVSSGRASDEQRQNSCTSIPHTVQTLWSHRASQSTNAKSNQRQIAQATDSIPVTFAEEEPAPSIYTDAPTELEPPQDTRPETNQDPADTSSIHSDATAKDEHYTSTKPRPISLVSSHIDDAESSVYLSAASTLSSGSSTTSSIINMEEVNFPALDNENENDFPVTPTVSANAK